MQRKLWQRSAATGASLALLLGLAGYIVADIYDAAPGFLTLKPRVAPAQMALPQPFPAMTPETDPKPGPPPSMKKAAEALAKLNDGMARAKGTVTVLVRDLETGKVLVEQGPNVLMVPASTTKLFTTSAAIRLLPPLGRATTATYLDGQNLYIKSEGDILLSPDKPTGSGADGHAGLGELADATAQKLKALQTNVKLRLDDTAIAGPERNPAWEAQGTGDYVGNTTDMAIHEGRRDPARARAFSHSPQADAVKHFAQLLRERGINVTGDVTSVAVPPSAQQLASVQSATNMQVLRYAEKTSDNTLMELLCRKMTGPLSARPNYQDAAEAMVKYLKEQGIDTEGVKLHDCSGLNTDNRVTARSLVELLQADVKDPKAAQLLGLLPVSSWDGTLTKRMRDGAAAGLVHAKTGSLSGVSTMAGLLRTQSGHNLVFAVMTDKFDPGAVYQVHKFIDNFLNELAAS